MKNKLYMTLTLLCLGVTTIAQVGIGTDTPNDAAILEIQSTDKGILLPRLELSKISSLSNVQGLMVYCTDCNNDKGVLKINNGTEWVDYVPSSGGSFSGNVGIGTDDQKATLHIEGKSILDGNLDVLTTNSFSGLYFRRYGPSLGIGSLIGHISFTNMESDELGPGLRGYSDGIWGEGAPTYLSLVTGKVGDSYERMRIDADGNVGIGEHVPNSKLHVNSGEKNVSTILESTDVTAAIQFKDPGGSAEVGNSGKSLILSPDGIEKMRIDANGKVTIKGDLYVEGIINDLIFSDEIADGTIVNEDISADTKIDGSKIDPDFGDQDISTNGKLNVITRNGNQLVAGFYQPTINTYGYNDYMHGDNRSGYFMWYKDYLKIHADNADKILLTGGNVGIGTDDPQYKLDILENSKNGVRIRSGDEKEDIAFSVGSASTSDKFVITAGGNVGIGTSTDTKVPLTVYGDINNHAASSAGYTNTLRLFGSHHPTLEFKDKTNQVSSWIALDGATTGGLKIFGGTSHELIEAKQALKVSHSGNVTIGRGASSSLKFYVYGTAGGTSSWSESSDQRWKKEIKTLDNSLNKITALRGVSYEWNHDEFPNKNFSEGTQIGVVAQEVESVFPELVHTDTEGFKSVSYSNLVAPLIEAVKELKEQNEEFRIRIESLEAELKNQNN